MLLVLLIASFFVLALAQTLSLRPQHPPAVSHALVEHSPPQHTRFPQPDTDVLDSLDLLDILLLASVDGNFHALNRTSGDILWSMSARASSSSKPSALAPLVRTEHVDYDPDLVDDSTPHEMYIIEPQSGDIYVLPNPSSPLQRFPFTMQELVDMSPFSFSSGDGDDDYDGRVFVGKKETSLLVVELETGKVKATLNSECPWDQFEEFRRDGREDDEVDLDELDGSKPQKPPTTDVYIGRTDYHVSIITRPNPTSSSYRPSTPNLVQNLSFSTYGPNKQENHLQSLYRRPKDNAYTQPLPSGDILSFRARSTVDSAIPSSWMNKHLLWMRQEFKSPMVAVFDVLRKKPTSSLSNTKPGRPFVLLQPRPKIQDLIPNLPSTVEVNTLAAYVGLVGGSNSVGDESISGTGKRVGKGKGSLFAMSPQNYPLVAFGRDEDEEYPLIDSEAHRADVNDREEEGKEEEEATTIDQLTELRKLREASSSAPGQHHHSKPDPQLCHKCTDTTSRYCLTGIRRLSQTSPTDHDAQTRMRRLLDASPGAMGYDDYKRFLSSNNGGFGFEEAGYANQYSNVDIGIGVGVEEERLTIDPPPVLPPLPAGGGETTTTQSLHSGIIVGLSRWETVGTTIIVVLVMMMLERWWKAVRRWVEFMRRGEKVPGVEREDAGAKVVREGENEEETVMDKQEERRAVGMDKNVDLVSPPLSKPTPASAVNEDKEVDANDAGYSPPPAPVPITPSASSNSANLTTLLVPTTPITTPVILVGEETDKEDNSDTEDFVVITENGAGGISTPKHQGEVPSTPTPDTPMKKKKTRRGKRPAKKPKNWNGVVAGEMVQGNGPALGKDGEVQETKTQTPVLAESSLIVKSAAKPVSTPSPSLLVSDTVLGYGSHGTVVYQGSLQGRAVAVKRLLADFVTLASREVSILQESDDHPNVIRYYYQEAHAGFLYIALELCPASLADIIETPDRDQWRDIAVNFDPKRALRQVTNGLRHLHGLKLIHRDIKPQNILITTVKGGSGSTGGGGPGDKGKGYRMLISDFGLCKKLEVDQTSFLPTAHGAMAAGTVGWRAPEILSGEVKLNELADDQGSQSSNTTVQGASVGSTHSNSSTNATGRRRLTKSVDIFALGCLYYYTLTGGGHPFGDRYEREVNIMKNAKSLEILERFGEEGTEATDLIERMLDPLPSGRPDTTSCLLHPFFWDSSRRLNFLQDASDRFEIMCRDPKDPDLLTLENGAVAIVGNDWHSRLDKIFIENLGKFRKYDGKSVQDLLRALRNKKHHYQDLPDHVKRHLGPMPEGFLAYFTRRFPKLFLHVHRVIKETGLADESMFRNYFELPDS